MLTPEQEDELRRCEAVIERHVSSGAYEKGAALRTIRDERLYDGHDSFETYCRVRWEISLPRAYQLINHASVCDNLSTIVEKPPREGHTRHLSGLTPERQREAWREVVAAAAAGKITGSDVAAVAERHRNRDPSDRGQPDDLEPGWHMSDELRAVRDVVLGVAERWPEAYWPILANKLIGLGHELLDNGRIA